MTESQTKYCFFKWKQGIKKVKVSNADEKMIRRLRHTAKAKGYFVSNITPPQNKENE